MPRADPRERQDLGELVLGQIVEQRLHLLLDAVVQLVLENRQRLAVLVVRIVDIVGRLIGIGGRNLRLQLLGAQDQPAEYVSSGVSNSMLLSPACRPNETWRALSRFRADS